MEAHFGQFVLALQPAFKVRGLGQPKVNDMLLIEVVITPLATVQVVEVGPNNLGRTASESCECKIDWEILKMGLLESCAEEHVCGEAQGLSLCESCE